MSLFIHRGDINDFLRKCPVTSFIAIINTIVFIVTLIFDQIAKYENPLILNGGVRYGALSNSSEMYRIVTSMFLHLGFMHYLFNIFFGVLIISAGLERLIGSMRFSIVYFGSGILSAIVIAVIPSINLTVGASGAIFGVIGCFVYIILTEKAILSDNDKKYIWILLIMNLVYTIIDGNISKVGHISGLVIGFLLGFIALIGYKRNYNWY